jgi:hypothetical protein
LQDGQGLGADELDESDRGFAGIERSFGRRRGRLGNGLSFVQAAHKCGAGTVD